MNDKELKLIVERIAKLEEAIFGSTKKTPLRKPISVDKRFTGISGGIRFLVTRDFFNNKRSLSDIRDELGKYGYYSSIQAVQTALNRFSRPGGILVAFKEGGKKVYAKRK